MPFAYQPRNEIGRIELVQEVLNAAWLQSRMSLSLVNHVDRAIRALAWTPLVVKEYELLLKQCWLIGVDNIPTQQGKEVKERILVLLV